METDIQSVFTLLDDERLMEIVLSQPKILEFAVRSPITNSEKVEKDAYWKHITYKFNEQQSLYGQKTFGECALRARWEILLELIQTKGNLLKSLAFPEKMCSLITRATDLITFIEAKYLVDPLANTPEYPTSDTPPFPPVEEIRPRTPPLYTVEKIIYDHMVAIQNLPAEDNKNLLADLMDVALQIELKQNSGNSGLVQPFLDNVMSECDNFFKKVNVTEELPDERPMLTNLTSAYTNRFNTVNKNANQNGVATITKPIPVATTISHNSNNNNMLMGVENKIPSASNGLSLPSTQITNAPLSNAQMTNVANVNANGVNDSPLPFVITDVRSLREIVQEVHNNNDAQTAVAKPAVVIKQKKPIPIGKQALKVKDNTGGPTCSNLVITDVRSLRQASDHLKPTPTIGQSGNIIARPKPNLPVVGKPKTNDVVAIKKPNEEPPPLWIRNVGTLRKDQLRAIINAPTNPKPRIMPSLTQLKPTVRKPIVMSSIQLESNQASVASAVVAAAPMPAGETPAVTVGPVTPVPATIFAAPTAMAPVRKLPVMRLAVTKNNITVGAEKQQQQQSQDLPKNTGCVEKETVATVPPGNQGNVNEKLIVAPNDLILNTSHKESMEEEDELTKNIKQIIGSSKIEVMQGGKRKASLSLLDGNAPKIPRIEAANVVEKEKVADKVDVEKIRVEVPAPTKRTLRSDAKNTLTKINEQTAAATNTTPADQEIKPKKQIKYTPYVPSRLLPTRSCKPVTLKKVVPLAKADLHVRKFHIRIKRDFKDHNPAQMTRRQANALKNLKTDLVNK